MHGSEGDLLKPAAAMRQGGACLPYPIKYGRIDTRYFKEHFLCFGRLPFYD